MGHLGQTTATDSTGQYPREKCGGFKIQKIVLMGAVSEIQKILPQRCVGFRIQNIAMEAVVKDPTIEVGWFLKIQ